MPRRNRKTLKGGFFDTLSNWGSSLWNNNPRQNTSNLTGYNTGTYQNYNQPTSYGQPTNYNQSMSSYGYGGKRSRQNTRRMKGGFKDNTPTTGLAAHAASFSGKTAQPHNLVGGKTRKNRKSRKYRRR